MPGSRTPRIAIGPDPALELLVEAIDGGGEIVVSLADADAIVWAGVDDPGDLATVIAAAPNATWIQLPWAGIESFVEVLDHDHVWTCGKGAYADPVAEIALTLGLTRPAEINTYAAATSWSSRGAAICWVPGCTIVGGGGIAESLIRMLQPFGCHITVVRRPFNTWRASTTSSVPTGSPAPCPAQISWCWRSR